MCLHNNNMNTVIKLGIVVAYFCSNLICITGEKEYCISEEFSPQCPHGELIVMTKAVYGYMGPSRCTQLDIETDCAVDVISSISTKCSWKKSCLYPVIDIERNAKDACLFQTRPSLFADYYCIAVETASDCTSQSVQVITNPEGSIAASIAKQTGCGSLDSPWKITASPGQSITLSSDGILMKVPDRNCEPLGYVTGDKSRNNMTICQNGHQNNSIHLFEGEGVIIQLIPQRNEQDNFIVDFKVNGCIDLLTPEFAWYTRQDMEAVVGCLYRNISWHLHCVESTWQGVIGKCQPKPNMQPASNDFDNDEKTDYSFLILICAAATMFMLLLVLATVGVVKLMDKRKHQQANVLMMNTMNTTNTTYRYSNEPKRDLPVGYNDGMDVVPDLLESSLQRPMHRHIAESECSSQTYYPGTMYFMGLQGPPQQDVQLPLPKPPNADSDSDSDHVYDKIPCD